MKTLTLSLIACLGLALVFGLSTSTLAQEEKEPEYVGTAKCKVCHSKQKLGGAEFLLWEKGPHAKAYNSLETDEAKEIAAKAGVDPKSDQCLACHLTSKTLLESSPEKEGVGCEACHGPGSLYRTKKIMEDYEASIKAGMRRIKDKDGDADKTKANMEKLCRTCHGLEHIDKNPAAKDFSFDEFWAKIKHDPETLKKQFPEAFE